ncbi:hypothetical protein BDM02DRAFT_3263395 [Thelephora ganbajun]|uniref:Uncharacterized protein n=1 Tax=Thelephora ganbajun TaxID=370292 RepID=A0ACB6Z591_THEGA|nr:hypothetical protein BDM02DRAFT_3263395 [Thelephora ganbajun]
MANPESSGNVDPLPEHGITEVSRSLCAKLARPSDNTGRHGLPTNLPMMRSLETDLRRALSMLRQRINPYDSPAYRLHPELLREIILYDVDLISATHVCHHWRAILLSTPTLWSRVAPTPLDKSKVYLERVCKAPIRVFMGAKFDEAFLGLLRDKIAQIVLINCRIRTLEPDWGIHSMSSMRKLIVNGYDEFFGAGLVANLERRVEMFPSLTLLSVSNTIDGLRLRTPHLTHFRFNFYKYRYWKSEGGVHLLVDFFRSCPMLEVIDVDYPSIPVERPRTCGPPVVHLPHLRSFRQGHEINDTVYLTELLDQLTFPPTCSIVLDLFSTGCKPDDMRIGNLFPALHFRETNFVDVRRVKIKVSNEQFTETSQFKFAIEFTNARGTKFLLDMLYFHEDEFETLAEPIYFFHMEPILKEWIEEIGKCGSVEMLCLEGREDLGDFVTPTVFPKISTLILSDVAIPSWFLSYSMRPWDDHQCPGGVRTFILHFRHLQPWDVDAVETLMQLAQYQKVKGCAFELLHLTFTDPEWSLLEELCALSGCVRQLNVVAGDNALDWKVDRHFLNGLEHCQWFGVTPEVRFYEN